VDNPCDGCKKRWSSHETFFNLKTGMRTKEEKNECQTWCDKYEIYLKENNIKRHLYLRFGYKQKLIETNI